jgi:cytochrome c oxidase assembly protein subunit 11
VPERAGPYFQKLQCFCFDAQTIAAGETRKFPVQYFVAPELATDRESARGHEITLSYTFYPSKDGAPQALGTAADGLAFPHWLRPDSRKACLIFARPARRTGKTIA